MSAQSLSSPEDQNVTFVELFFDLVFVFSVTQVVGLFHHGISWGATGQGVLVFWLVWWAWTQFTWALNAADTTHQWIQSGTLLATAVAFVMAVAVPGAFDRDAMWFAVPYVLVRAMGLLLYYWVAYENPTQRAAVRTFAVVSVGGLAAVIFGGLSGGSAQYAFWGLAILLDVIAAAVGGQSEGWNLHPEHFVERHGLFVIIALGETLIVAAGGVTGASWTGELVAITLLVVAITCGLWWSYFTVAKPELDRALASCAEASRAMMARDAFSLAHFPLICGVIAYAAAIEQAVTHPLEPLALEARVSLGAGILLFIGGMAVAMWRATCGSPLGRTIAAAVTAIVVVAWAGTSPWLTLTLSLVGILVIIVLEQSRGASSPVAVEGAEDRHIGGTATQTQE
jgi:low temperature requirement protein LtrA